MLPIGLLTLVMGLLDDDDALPIGFLELSLRGGELLLIAEEEAVGESLRQEGGTLGGCP